jgi:hypothetical protein
MAYPQGDGFVLLRAKQAMKALRAMVGALDVDGKVSEYVLHSGRHGGASALATAGASDMEIMLGGGWHSTAFFAYLHNDPENERFSNMLIPPGSYHPSIPRSSVPGAASSATASTGARETEQLALDGC